MISFRLVFPCLAVTCLGLYAQDVEPESVALSAELDPAWIWGQAEAAGNQRVFFAASIQLDHAAEIVDGVFTADNAFKLWVDGKPLVRGDDFRQPERFQDGPELAPGEHLFCVAATNVDGPAALAGFIELELEDGERVYLQTSAEWSSWSQRPEAWPVVGQGFENARVLGSVGAPTEPWGDLFGLAELPDPATFTLPEGFICERIYAGSPREGSWASMTFGAGGSLYVSGERGSLFAFELSDELLSGAPAKALPRSRGPLVEGISVAQEVALPVHSAQGLEWAHDSLYVVMSTEPDNQGGLHRLRDTSGDGTLDQHEQLASFGTQSEHGAHGIRVAPDGSLYLLTGNYVKFPESADPGSGLAHLTEDFPPHVQEDVLLPRIWDPLGHAGGIMAPGGQLWRTDKDGATWQQVSSGLRNSYDLAITPTGEVFTYDADMEWDLGTPWYRSPRVLQLIEGGEYGWRAGTAKWPATYPDSLPPVVETDLASPTGVEYGAGSAFGPAFQRSLFLGDWAWGRITLAHLRADGAGYAAEVETLVEGRGLAITDLEIGPDGWLWFIIGGRGTKSGLFRIRQEVVGERGDVQIGRNPAQLVLAQLLAEDCGVELALGNLRSEDRVLATAARLVLERTEPSLWLPKKAAVDSYLVLPLARAWPTEMAHKLDTGELSIDHWFEAQRSVLVPVDEHALRTAMVVRMRLAANELDALLPKWGSDLAHVFPSAPAAHAREIGRLLTSLIAAGQGAAEQGSTERGADTPGDTDQGAAEQGAGEQGTTERGANSLGNTDQGAGDRVAGEQGGGDKGAGDQGTADRGIVDLRDVSLPELFLGEMQPGASQEHQLHFALLLRLVDRGWNDSLRAEYFTWFQQASQFQGGASLTGFLNRIKADALTHVPDSLAEEMSALTKVAAPTSAPSKERPFVRDWTLAELLDETAKLAGAADAARGATIFRDALCIQCHRVQGIGGALGPDLTSAARRFGRRDLFEAIIDPAAAVSDQYKLIQMPAGLLNGFTAAEVADLDAFLESSAWPSNGPKR